MDNDTTPTKVCTKCGIEKPATLEYFHKAKDGQYGLRGTCKECRIEESRLYQEQNREVLIKKSRQYYLDNHAIQLEARRKYYQENKEQILEQMRQYRNDNPELIQSRKHLSYQRNKATYQQYHKNNRGQILIRKRKYYLDNRERLLEDQRQYREENKDYFRVKKAKYRARKVELPDTFTEEQWIACVEYFNYCCAVCGVQLRDLFGNIEPHADHWIPLDSEDCPGTTVDNMVCLCNKCNLSKGAKLPHEWLYEYFASSQAKAIMDRINTYFEWVKV